MTFHATTNKITRGFREDPRKYFQSRKYFQVESTSNHGGECRTLSIIQSTTRLITNYGDSIRLTPKTLTN